MATNGITTPRLILESLAPVHADHLFVGLRDVQLYEFIDAPPPESVEALRLQYQRQTLGTPPDGREIWRNWAIRVRRGERYAGYVQATIDEDRSAAIAYVLFREFWHHGYGREAVTAMILHVRDAHAVTRFRANVDPRNIRSVALLESLGFKQTARRINCVNVHGISADESEYVLPENPI